MNWNDLEDFLKIQNADLHLQNSDSIDLVWGPENLYFNKFPGNAYGSQETTFGKRVGWTIAFISQQKESITDAQICQHLNL